MNRPYPLLVKSEEEVSVRNAAKLINERIKAYRERFSVKDDLDLVIMCCLELATDNLHQIDLIKSQTARASEQMEEIDETLNATILNLEESGIATNSK